MPQEHTKATKGQDFPYFYKNGHRYTAVWSEKSFTEVHAMKTMTRISSGSNVHIIEDAQVHDIRIDKAQFESAYQNAINKITLS